MSMTSIFALCDINSFYASCEQLFNPRIQGKPVVVASNNDGCVVARSAEAKALGIKMGQPIFELRDLRENAGLVVQSSNYGLYADMSSRFFNTLEVMAPRVMPYSIDEAFLDLSGIETAISLEDFGHQVKETVFNWTGLPICVGIAQTPTLSKLANHAAKKYLKTKGVVNLTDPSRQRKLLSITPVGDIWGIGSKISSKLKAQGIETGLQLADSNPKVIKKQFSVVVERTVHELNGITCQEMEEVAPTKQQIVCSKSFGRPVTTLADLKSALAQHSVRAMEKLRSERREVGSVTVFIATSQFHQGDQYAKGLSKPMPYPTADTMLVTHHAIDLLQSIWRQGFRYSKAGIILSDFKVPGVSQGDLFDSVSDAQKKQELMGTVDKINRSLGSGTVVLARQARTERPWEMKRQNLSPSYTTRWRDIPAVN